MSIPSWAHPLAYRDSLLGLDLVTELPLDQGAVLGVAVALGHPGATLGPQLAELLWLNVAVLLLHRLLTDRPGGVVAIVLGNLAAGHLLAVPTIAPLGLLTVDLDCVLADNIVYDSLLVLAV
jgi:hypothetical protein